MGVLDVHLPTPSHIAPRIYPGDMLYPNKDLYMNVLSSFIFVVFSVVFILC